MKHPDGLKVIAPNLLAMGEAAGAMSTIKVTNNSGTVSPVISGLRGVATLALSQASAWVVEGQGDHFWDAATAGPNANPPFRLMEIPLAVGAGRGIVNINTSRFFPEGVTVDATGNFYVGSMDLGAIYKVAAGTTTAAPFIAPDTTNDLVSVLGLYADSARNRLWVCSSDAGNAQRSGSAPVALKVFNLTTGAFIDSWAWPAPPAPLTPIAGATVNGFCNDITVGPNNSVYATDSWYPRVLRLVNGGAGPAMLTNWLVSSVFPQDQWHLNGIDIESVGRRALRRREPPGTSLPRADQHERLGGDGRRGDDPAAALRPRRSQVAEPDHARDGGGQRRARRHRPHRHRHDGAGAARSAPGSTGSRPSRCGAATPGWWRTRGITSGTPADRTARPPPSRSGWSRRR